MLFRSVLLVLGIETSTRIGSVGVVEVPGEGAGGAVVLAEANRDSELRHGAFLPGLLDEALEASLLLHVVDASDPTFRQQYAVTREVLDEIGADDVPSRLVLNKIDRVGPEEREALAIEYPDALQLSAKDPADISRLRDVILAFFDRDLQEAELFVPWARGALIGEVHNRVRVLEEVHEAEGVRYRVRGRRDDVGR